MIVKIEKIDPKAEIPFKKHTEDACYDLVATSVNIEENYIVYGLGFKTEIPPGWEAVIRPRSSIRDMALVLCNSPATIDSNYRGEWKLCFKIVIPNILTAMEDQDEEGKSSLNLEVYEVGERIAQVTLKRVEEVTWEEGTVTDNTERGDGGFGSTGK